VATDGDEAISRQGVWLWRFQRVVSGVRVPTRAEVGVRVYDQLVAHYRSEHRPYDPALLGGLLTREALRASVAKRQGDTAQVTLWLDERLELAEVDKQWRPVWQLWYEVRQRAWPATRATLALDQETVDARSGEPIRDRRDPRTTRDMSEELLAFYLARGGQFAARPKPLPAASYTDSAPVFAPDGRRLAFLSNRPREGFPAWLARSNGAFVCDADGRQTVCVDLGPCLGVDFAPDGRQALVVRGDELVTVDLATGARRRVPRTLIEPLSRGGDHRPPGWTQATWPVADRLVALVDAGGQPQLVVVDLAPAQPTVAPMELKADGKPVVGHLTGVGRLPDGRALVAVNQKGPFQRARERFGEVWAVDPRDPAAAPRLLAKELPLVQRLTRGPAGKLLLWDDRTLPERWLLDPATGQVSELPAGVGAEAGRDLRPGLAWSPDGRLTCWSERHWTGQDRDPAAHVLWVGDAQAKGGRPLLAPTADLPQVLGEGK
jgi:hypothetical protein